MYQFKRRIIKCKIYINDREVRTNTNRESSPISYAGDIPYMKPMKRKMLSFKGYPLTLVDQEDRL